MLSQSVLLACIAGVGLVFFGLTVVIVLNKAWRETRVRRRRVRWWDLEPKILEWVHGDGRSVLLAFPGGVRPRDRDLIEDILLAHILRVRGIARERLRLAFDQLGFVEDALAELRSARWWYRAQAAERLGLAGAARATDALVAALEDEVFEVRIRAAKALGVVGGKTAVRSLIGALEQPTRWSSLRIADILAEMGTDVVDELVAEFPAMGVPARLAILDILGRVRSFHVATWLRARTEDPEPDVRARACHAIGAIGDPEAGPALRRALRDPAWPVRAMAAKALGLTKQMEAVPDLCESLRDPEWWVRSNSGRALRGMGPAGLDALVWMLEDRDPFARQQAVLMLQEAGILDQRVDLLARPEPDVRAATLAFVRRFVQAGQVGRLRELAVVHPDAAVRERLRQELDGIEEKAS